MYSFVQGYNYLLGYIKRRQPEFYFCRTDSLQKYLMRGAGGRW